MKSMFTDFLLCGGVLGSIIAAALALVGRVLSPWVRMVFGDYYVIVNVLLFMFTYGVISGLVLQLMLKLRPLPRALTAPVAGLEVAPTDHGLEVSWTAEPDACPEIRKM